MLFDEGDLGDNGDVDGNRDDGSERYGDEDGGVNGDSGFLFTLAKAMPMVTETAMAMHIATLMAISVCCDRKGDGEGDRDGKDEEQD